MAEKRAGKRKFRWWLLLPILLIVYTIYLFAANLMELSTIQQKQAEAQETLQSIESNNESLNEQIEYTDTQSFIERKARELLGWIYPDEYYLVGGD